MESSPSMIDPSQSSVQTVLPVAPTVLPTAPGGALATLGERLRREMARVVVGQEEVIEQILICLMARGHVVLEGVPGIAKTLIAKTVAYLIGADFKRVQFTPDLMPTDITGTNVFDSKSSTFYLKRGPVFTNLLLADEINRTPPKTQAALLEAMEERRVTIDGVDHNLEEPFLVIATQNPVEYEGTYPLPEAQLDRFLMKVLVTYPSADQEVEILRKFHAGFDPHVLEQSGLQKVCDGEALMAAAAEVETVIVQDPLLSYIAEITRRTRGVPQIALGASPRASIALLLCAKVLAALRGRSFVTPDEIKSLAPPILRHRLVLQPEAELEGITADQVIASILAAVPVPR